MLILTDVQAGAEALGAKVGDGGVSLRKIERAYGIPFRCLVPTDVDGAVAAGRAISASYEATGTVRGHAVCMATGHAAGTIAALSAQEKLAPRDLDITRLRWTLELPPAIPFEGRQ